jgi:hypothetical protein
MTLKEEWDVDSAMQVLKHPTVDAKLWAEAVEWLLLYGPDEVREILLNASGTATHECFPDMQAKGYAADGQPCYSVEELAKSLHIDTEETKEIIRNKEKAHDLHHFIDEEDTTKLQ